MRTSNSPRKSPLGMADYLQRRRSRQVSWGQRDVAGGGAPCLCHPDASAANGSLLVFEVRKNKKAVATEYTELDGTSRKSILRVIPSLFPCIPWLRLLSF